MADDRLDKAGDAAGLAAMISRAADPSVVCRPWIAGIRLLRRYRHGNPRRRHVVLHGNADRARGAGAALLDRLRRDEDGKTYLVTPVEKVGIRVEDAPFLAVEMTRTERDGEQVLTFRTNVGDLAEAGPEHELRFEIAGEKGELKPYLHVRGRLEALVSRAVMYDLVELGEVVEIEGKAMFAVRSGGTVFPVMPADELERLSQ